MTPFEAYNAKRRARLARQMDAGKQERRFGSPQYVNRLLQPKQSIEYAANSGVPLLADAAGLAQDLKMFKDQPESRTIPNMMLSGFGLLPFVPSLGAIRPIKTAKGKNATMDQMNRIMDENRWLDRGQKVGARQKIWRGAEGDPYAPNNTGDDSLAMADYGRGLYTTTDKKEALQYGTAHDLGKDALPKKPIRFRDAMAYKNWKYNMLDELGYKRQSDMPYDYDDLLIRDIDPDIDGVQIGEGAGAFFVKFPEHTQMFD